MPPDAVAYPETTEEVAEIVRICAQHGCPVIGWGTGTSLEGHTAAPRGGLCVDFSRMNRVLAINMADMDVTVEPGVTREALNQELRATGLFFSVDPGANASIGGMAATRASGTTALRYGTMRDNVLGVQAVLGDGRVIRTGSRARKSAAGFDLTALMVGSEGTLGLITELTLKLHGQPEAISAGICTFETVRGAVDTVIETIQMGLRPARMELVDSDTARAFNGYAGAEMREAPHLMMEFHGTPESVAAEARTFGEIAAEHGGGSWEWSVAEEERRMLWAMRHNAYYAILSLKPRARALVTDVCVPISNLAQAIDETRADIAGASIPGPIAGHAGDGNFHAVLLVDPDHPDELEEAKRISHRMVERALSLGGTSTGEHGIGMGKMGYMAREHGEGWQVMSALKHALDPQNIMNPGKVVAGN